MLKEYHIVKLTSTVNKSGACARNTSSHEKHTHQQPSPVLVAHGPINKTHENGSGHGANVGSPDVLLGHAQRGLDFGKKGRNGEPDEEGREESHPGAVEGAHVGTFEAEELDFGGLVILIGVDLEVVGLVLLDFGLAGGNSSRHDGSELN